MDSILRAFGRSSKVVEKTENVKAAETNEVSQSLQNDNSIDTSEDDIFSNLVVSTPMAAVPPVSRCVHLEEIGDLDVTKSEPITAKNEQVNDDGVSAFPFMNRDRDDGDENDTVVMGLTDTEEQNNQNITGDKEIETSSSCKELNNSDLDKSETNCVEQKSYSKFPFIRQHLRCENTDTHGSSRIKHVKKTKKSSVKPGFGNIDTKQMKKRTLSESSLVGSSGNIENTSCDVTCDEEIQEDNVSINDTASGNDDVDKVNEVPDGTGILENCDDDDDKHEISTTDENTVCISDELVNTCKKDSNIVDDLNLGDGTNIACNKGVKTITERYTTKCTSLNQEHLVMKEDKNETAIETDNDSESATGEISCNVMSNEIKSSNICISEGNSDNSKDCNVPTISTNQSASDERCLTQIADIEISADTDEVSDEVANKTENYNLDLSEEEKIMLKIDALQCQEETFRIAKSELLSRQKELIIQWKCEHLIESSICLKISELRQLQVKLESEENYDEACEINQNIMKLIDKCENKKYEYPLLDNKFLNLIKDHESLCVQHKNEHATMLKEYDNIMSWFKAKHDKNVENEEKKLNEMALLLKEKKLKVERDLSHTSLDKGHLIKSEIVLNEEIEKQTKKLNKERGELIDKKAIICSNIEELMAKLNILQEEENDLTASILNIESKIQSIMDDFQPRIDDISREKEHTEVEATVLASKLVDLVVEEEKIKSKNEDIVNQRQKNEETISLIESNIARIQKLDESSENEAMFSFQNSLDFKGLEFDADTELVRSKEHVIELQSQVEDLNNRISADEVEEKRLQRSLNDLEAQLSELQKLKQVHVKERKYKDAKLTSDHIKILTSKGESISCDAIKLNESIKLQKNEIEDFNVELAKAQETFNANELIHDQHIIEKLKKLNISIENLLHSQLASWRTGILELQLLNNNNIIHDLSTKHGLLFWIKK